MDCGCCNVLWLCYDTELFLSVSDVRMGDSLPRNIGYITHNKLFVTVVIECEFWDLYLFQHQRG